MSVGQKRPVRMWVETRVSKASASVSSTTATPTIPSTTSTVTVNRRCQRRTWMLPEGQTPL
jgi:hypothetical protein